MSPQSTGQAANRNGPALRTVDDLRRPEAGNREAPDVEAEVRNALSAMSEAAWIARYGIYFSSLRVIGEGPTASADFELTNGRTITFDPVLRELTNLKHLAAVLTSAAGAKCKPSGDDALTLLEHLYRAAVLIPAADADAEARDLGAEFLQATPALGVVMVEQASRWEAFTRIGALSPERAAREEGRPLADAMLVLVDTDGTRLVRCGWFHAWARLRDPRIGDNAAINRRMARVGWERRGKTGRIMARAPHSVDGPRSLVWSFFLVAPGWEDPE